MLDSLAASLAATLEASLWPGLADRAVLVLNHLLRSQGSASQRLVAHAGKSVRLEWRSAEPAWPKPPALRLRVTPAGLFENDPILPVDAAGSPDSLCVEVDLPAPLDLPRSLIDGRRPATRVEGDTQLATDLAWLAENLRWDAEDDLSRVIGDLPARTLVMAGRAVQAGLRGLAGRVRPRQEGEVGPGAAASR
jgi:ubiquinone biosynthesis accessory factor UbiJ